MYHVKKIEWEDIKDIRVVPILTGGVWLRFYSENMTQTEPTKFIDKRGIIEVQLSLKLIETVMDYTQIPILDINGTPISIDNRES